MLPHHRHRLLRRLGSVLGIGAFLLPLFGAPAGADRIADKRAEAARIARQLDAQGEKVSILAERLNEARLKADSVTAQAQAAKADLARTDQMVAGARNKLKAQAVTSYMRGGQLPTVQMLARSASNDIGVRNAYVSTITGQERSALDDMHAAREQIDAKRAALESAQVQARAALTQVEASRRAAADAEAVQEAMLARVKGELGALVAAENQRRAAEAARRAQAEYAARAARAAAARNRTGTPNIGGSALPSAQGAERAVAEARAQLGKPYRYGAAGPDSFDCSGLTMWSWGHAGRSLPHSAAAQYSATSRVSVDALQPGDLLFYGSPIHHVGMFVGGGQMIEASQTGTPVRYASIYRRDLVGAGRVG